MRFLIDANLSPRLGEGLRARGMTAVHVAELGLMHASDRQIFAKAAAEKMTLITSDLDFGEILANSNGEVSTIIFRIRGVDAAILLQRLDTVMTAAMQALQEGALVIVEPRRIRIRHLPLTA